MLYLEDLKAIRDDLRYKIYIEQVINIYKYLKYVTTRGKTVQTEMFTLPEVGSEEVLNALSRETDKIDKALREENYNNLSLDFNLIKTANGLEVSDLKSDHNIDIEVLQGMEYVDKVLVKKNLTKYRELLIGTISAIKSQQNLNNNKNWAVKKNNDINSSMAYQIFKDKKIDEEQELLEIVKNACDWYEAQEILEEVKGKKLRKAGQIQEELSKVQEELEKVNKTIREDLSLSQEKFEELDLKATELKEKEKELVNELELINKVERAKEVKREFLNPGGRVNKVERVYAVQSFYRVTDSPVYEGRKFELSCSLIEGEGDGTNPVVYTKDTMSIMGVDHDVIMWLVLYFHLISEGDYEIFNFNKLTPDEINAKIAEIHSLVNRKNEEVSLELMCADLLSINKKIDLSNISLDGNNSLEIRQRLRVVNVPFIRYSSRRKALFMVKYFKSDDQLDSEVSFEDFKSYKPEQGKSTLMMNGEWVLKHTTSNSEEKNAYLVSVYANEVTYPKMFQSSATLSGFISDETTYATYTNEELMTIVNDKLTSINMNSPLNDSIKKEKVALRNIDEGIVYTKGNNDFNSVPVIRKNGKVKYKIEREGDNFRVINIDNPSTPIAILAPHETNLTLNLRVDLQETGQVTTSMEIPKCEPGVRQTSSRLVLDSIIKRYSEKYGAIINTPLTNDWVFAQNKRDILKDYFKNLTSILKDINETVLIPLKETVRDNRDYTNIVYSLLDTDVDEVVNMAKSNNLDLSINANVLEELLNLVILLQENTRNFDKKTAFELSEINLSEENLDYDRLTLQDLWGYNFARSTGNNKAFYTVNGGNVSLKVETSSNQNKIPNSVFKVMFLMKVIYCCSNLISKMDEVEEICEEIISKEEEEVRYNITDGGIGEGLAREPKWEELGIEPEWGRAYRDYIRGITSTVKVDVDIDLEYLSSLYTRCLIESSSNAINLKNQLFFNRVALVEEFNGKLPNYVNLVDKVITVGGSYLTEIMCHVEGICPATSAEALEIINTLGIKVNEFKYPNLDMSNQEALEGATRRVFLTKPFLKNSINSYIELFRCSSEEELLRLKDNSGEHVELLDEIIFNIGLPTLLNSETVEDIEEYISEANRITINKFGVEVYQSYDKGNVCLTSIRDMVTLNRILNTSAVVNALEKSKDNSNLLVRFERKFKDAFNRLIKTDTADVYTTLKNLTPTSKMSEEEIRDLVAVFDAKTRNLVTHPLELGYLQTELLNKIGLITTESTNILNNAVFKDNISLEELHEVEEKVNRYNIIVGLYKALTPYIPINKYVEMNKEFNNLKEVINSKYLCTELNISPEEKRQNQQAEIFFKLYLQTGDDKYRQYDVNKLSFETLTSDEATDSQVYLSPYSKRDMLVKYELFPEVEQLKLESTKAGLDDVHLTLLLDAVLCCYASDGEGLAQEADRLGVDLDKFERFYKVCVTDYDVFLCRTYPDYLDNMGYSDVLQKVETMIKTTNGDIEFLEKLPKAIERYVGQCVLEIPEYMVESYNRDSVLKFKLKSK